MTAEAWGRVRRGVVWHLITGPDSTLCEGGLYGPSSSCAPPVSVPYVEVSMGLPPSGGRPCPRCVGAVDDLAITVINAVAGQELRLTRPVEDVDLLSSLPDSIKGPLGYGADLPEADSPEPLDLTAGV